MEENVFYPDLTKLCRLCLCKNGANIKIFQRSEGMNSKNHLSVPVRIMACSSLEVHPDDGLPDSICRECRLQLEKCYYFRKRAQHSDNRLRKHIRLINLGKKSRVFEQNPEDEFEDELEFEDSIQFIKEQECEKDEEQLAYKQALRLEMEQKVQLMQKSFDEKLSNMKVELRSQIEKELRPKIEIEAKNDLQKYYFEKCRQDDFDLFLDDLELYLRAKLKKRKPIMIQELLGNDDTLIEETKTTKKHDAVHQINTPKTTESLKKEFENTEVSYEVLANEIFETGNETNENDPKESDFYIVENIENRNESDSEMNKTEMDDVSYGSEHYEVTDTNEDQSITTLIHIDENSLPDDIMYYDVETKADMENDVDMDYVNEKKRKKISLPTPNNKNVKENESKDLGFKKCIIRNAGEEESNDVPFRRGTDTPKTFKCSSCPMSFSTSTAIERHYRSHLKAEQKGVAYKCSECKVFFSCKSALTRHQVIHTGKKPHTCSTCGKSFIQREILKRHEQTHSNEKPYPCPHCSRAYTQKVNLTQHIKHYHSDGRKAAEHACHLCPRQFNHASGLSRHLTSHSGVTYKCSECERNFADRSSVKRHVMHVHGATNIENANKYIKECPNEQNEVKT